MIAEALASHIALFDKFEVVAIVSGGRALQTYLAHHPAPALVLLDIGMPDMDGFATASYLREHYPNVRVVVLSMHDREDHIIRMIRLGARGYVLKGSHAEDLRLALTDVVEKGFHNTDFLTQRIMNGLNGTPAPVQSVKLNDRERHFLQLSATELTYVQIADKMSVSPRTVDGYREALFEKMNAKSRVGLVLEGLRLGLITL